MINECFSDSNAPVVDSKRILYTTSSFSKYLNMGTYNDRIIKSGNSGVINKRWQHQYNEV